MSESHKGHKSYWNELTTYWKGRKKSKEHQEKINQSLKGRKAWNKDKKIVWIYNPILQKTRQVLLEDLKNHLIDGWVEGKLKTF